MFYSVVPGTHQGRRRLHAQRGHPVRLRRKVTRVDLYALPCLGACPFLPCLCRSCLYCGSSAFAFSFALACVVPAFAFSFALALALRLSFLLLRVCLPLRLPCGCRSCLYRGCAPRDLRLAFSFLRALGARKFEIVCFFVSYVRTHAAAEPSPLPSPPCRHARSRRTCGRTWQGTFPHASASPRSGRCIDWV